MAKADARILCCGVLGRSGRRCAQRSSPVPKSVEAQNPRGVNAEEFLLLDSKGKARAGLELDANGEVGLVLRSKDGNRTLTLSPDDSSVIRLVERGRVLWGSRKLCAKRDALRPLFALIRNVNSAYRRGYVYDSHLPLPERFEDWG